MLDFPRKTYLYQNNLSFVLFWSFKTVKFLQKIVEILQKL